MIGDQDWRAAEVERLLDFAAGARTERGFGWLDDVGVVRPDPRRELWINARMTYVFASAHRLGLGLGGTIDVEALAVHGVRALAEIFADHEWGGWVRAVGTGGPGGPEDDVKACYEHAFVLLAGCAASDAGIAGGAELAADAARVHVERFLDDADDAAGRCREEWSRDWSRLDPYRGANSNMHTVEAYLAAAHTFGDPVWVARAERIVEGIVGVAAEHDWRIVEHFDEHWTPLPEQNRDRPADPFRPYGSTPGHGFEWARLLLQLDPQRHLEAARQLFERAAADTGEGTDGSGGFAYTVDWQGRPVVEERFHWVLCEALLAADALAAVVPDEPRYPALQQAWWALAERAFVDREWGSWHHELSATLGPSSTTWSGKPDAYHVFNALTMTDPRLGLS